eukprot:428476_1
MLGDWRESQCVSRSGDLDEKAAVRAGLSMFLLSRTFLYFSDRLTGHHLDVARIGHVCSSSSLVRGCFLETFNARRLSFCSSCFSSSLSSHTRRIRASCDFCSMRRFCNLYQRFLPVPERVGRFHDDHVARVPQFPRVSVRGRDQRAHVN